MSLDAIIIKVNRVNKVFEIRPGNSVGIALAASVKGYLDRILSQIFLPIWINTTQMKNLSIRKKIRIN